MSPAHVEGPNDAPGVAGGPGARSAWRRLGRDGLILVAVVALHAVLLASLAGRATQAPAQDRRTVEIGLAPAPLMMKPVASRSTMGGAPASAPRRAVAQAPHPRVRLLTPEIIKPIAQVTPLFANPPDLVAPKGPTLASPVTGAAAAAATGGDGAGAGAGAGGYGGVGDTPAQWLAFAPPDVVEAHYPRHAMRARIEGSALLGCDEGVDGRVHACRLLSETPLGEQFGRAAIAISPYFRFSPKRVGGRAVEARLVVPVDFSLTDDPRDEPPPPPGKEPSN